MKTAIFAIVSLFSCLGVNAEVFLVRSGPGRSTPVADAFGSVPVGERFCTAAQCVVSAETPAQQLLLNQLVTREGLEIDRFREAQQIFFRVGTYDASRHTFGNRFERDGDVLAGTTMGLFAVTFESLPEQGWVDTLKQTGFVLVEPLGATTLSVYGPRAALPKLRTQLRFLVDVLEIPSGVKFVVDPDDSGAKARVAIELVDAASDVVLPLLASAAGRPAVPTYEREGIRGFDSELSLPDSYALRDWLRVKGFTDASPALVKSTLIAGAQNLCTTNPCNSINGLPMRPAPDQQQGWGGVSLDRYFGAAANYYFYDQQTTFVRGSGSWTKTLTIDDTSRPVSIALVWTDAAASVTVATTTNLINDLDLRATVNGHTYYGNNYYTDIYSLSRDGYSLQDPSPVYDRKNNVEKIDIRASELPVGGGTITVTVTPAVINGDGLNPYGTLHCLCQDFALAVINAHE